MPLNKQYRVAIYLRLSKDDGDDVESESITNQRKIIMDYMNKKNNLSLYDEYVDDGYSGANFNRPNFKRMLSDIEMKKIDMVITKNLARLGRNYIETGTYIQKYFPDHSVRYIALLDNVDNYEDRINNDFVPIQSIFNEKHCKDTSIAVKKTKRRKMQEGFYACNTAPFGYKKDLDHPGKLVIDEESAKTVRKIFELKLQGYTINKIVEYLDKNNYITPAKYLNIKGLENVPNKEIWKKSSVTKILSNQVYLGHCVRGKTEKLSYKAKKRLNVKRNNYIVTYHTHEPIISEEIFYKVHNTKKYGFTRERKETNYLLKNFIYCKNCGKKLIFKKERNKLYIYCRSHSENPKLCSNECKLNYYDIEDKVFNDIVNMYKEYFKSSKSKDNLYKKYIEYIIKKMESDLTQLKQAQNKLNFKVNSLYKQRLSGKIEDTSYKDKYASFLNNRKELEEQIKNIEKEKIDQKSNILKQKNQILKKLERIEKKDFNRIDMKELIEKIDVYKNKISIYFRFSEIGNFKC